MDYSILKITIAEGIATVVISRPEAMNALNTLFFTELNAFLDDAAGNSGIKIIILTGEGKAFVAGADIAEMVNKNSAEGTAFSKVGQDTFARLENIDIPVIAAVNGFALGGGCELAMACDIRIASNKAKFGQPEVNLGLIPGYAGTQRLARLTSLGNALMMLYTADMVTADDALRMGLVQKVVEPEALMTEVTELAKKIITKGPQSVKLIKYVTRKGLMMDFNKGCELEAEKFGTLFGTGSEGEEGMKAFLEKRKPSW
ncbi:MAG: enoyl-CoA hydratase-related protein [Bacteroidota bacterium]